ncbi:KTSC domain-containing protein [Aquibacillus halophilus]|uniref:KTSC domain-containing protein n=1 Tax=Aquibacillus halophilus TaxID=930132 RepID=A0A6A8DGR2_9BACI|nr:KTSC domain-containing protein [Aquibacillus halophilus]MRH43039.1 KTSC domain-containing protein [Aquibacillus halophilus]
MNVARFDRNLWNITSFERVGYDKKDSILTIFFLDGFQIEFAEVDELIVFEFIISTNKEDYIKNVLLSNYPYIQLPKSTYKSS